MPNRESWNIHIGSWKKRTLLAKECELLGSTRGQRAPAGGQPAAQLGRTIGGSQLHLNIQPLRVGAPAAAIIWLAGCPFLIGAPTGIRRLLKQAKLKPRRLILLSWDPAHVAGLGEYCELAGAAEVWTSAWIEKEIKDSPEWRERNPPLKRLRWQTFEENLPHSFRTQVSRGANTAAFDGDYQPNAFSPQVGWRIYYEISNAPIPRLHVEFRLLGSKLTVRLERSAWDDALLPTSEEYQERVVEPLLRRHPQARQELMPILGQRLSELSMLTEDPAAADAAFAFTMRDATLLRLGNPGKQALADALHPRRVIEPGPPRLWHYSRFVPVPPSTILLERTASLRVKPGSAPKIHLAIGCGLFSDPSGGELKAGQRFLLEGNGRAARSTARATSVSMLGLKILDFLRDQCDPARPVFEPELLLMVSPWTEANVRQEVARLQQEFPTLWHGEINVRYLVQKVAFQEVSSDDGSPPIEYYPAGHFDFLELVGEIEETIFQEADRATRRCVETLCDNTFIYFTNYNNIGRNIDGKVREMVTGLRPDKQSQRCLLFELTRQAGADPLGSCFVKNPSTGALHLVKPEYVLPPGQHGQGRDAILDTKGRRQPWISTGSVLIHVASLLGKLDLIRKAPFIRRCRALAPGMPERLRKERDLDLITMVPGLAPLWTAAGVEGTRRFFPLKGERDLTITAHAHINELYNAEFVAFAARGARSVPARLDGPLILTPDLSHAPWGFERVAILKGLSPDVRPVAEAKELNIHPFSVSGFQLNVLEHLPIVRALAVNDAAISVKQLDCNDWLSIQMHPDGRTAETLAGLLSSKSRSHDKLYNKIRSWLGHVPAGSQEDVLRELHGQLRLLKDDQGKAEVFYVVRNDAEQDGARGLAPHFLGIENVQLQEKLSGVEREDPRHGAAILRSPIGDLESFLNWDRFYRLKQDSRARLSRAYRRRFRWLVDYHLPVVLRLRKDIGTFTNSRILRGIVLILAVQAFTDVIRRAGTGARSDRIIPADRANLIRGLYCDPASPLLGYFHLPRQLKVGSILHVKPGVIHAAGPGLLTVEVSHRSDNTFRILDHGREFGARGRETHFTLAALALSEDSFFDEQNELSAIRHSEELEEIQKRDRSISPIRFGNIELDVLTPGLLKGSGTPLLDNSPRDGRGVIVLCTAGKVRLTRKDGDGKRVLAELPELHAALFPKRPADGAAISIEADKYSEATCVRTWMRLAPVQPAVVVAVGGTHVQFTYDSGKPGDVHLKRFRWHEVLPSLLKAIRPAGNRLWNERLRVLSDKLVEFLDEYHKSEGAVRLLGISWPGLVTPDTASMHSSVLGCQELTAMELAEQVRNRRPRWRLDTEQTQVLFDAKADASAELGGLMGGLPRVTGKGAMLWNFGSGICAVAVKDGKIVDHIGSSDEDSAVSLSHIGRQMWFNQRTREWRLQRNWNVNLAIERIRRGEYNVECPFPEGESEWIRLSDCLSTTAIILQFFRVSADGWVENRANVYPGVNMGSVAREARRKLLANFYEQTDKDNLRRFFDRCAGPEAPWSETLTTYRPCLNALAAPLFEWMGKAFDRENEANGVSALVRGFTESVAFDFAAMLAAFFKQTGEIDAKGILPAASQKLVFGAFGGTAFGRARNEDVFVRALTRALGQYPGVTVREVVRSRMFLSDFRLMDVFRRAEEPHAKHETRTEKSA